MAVLARPPTLMWMAAFAFGCAGAPVSFTVTDQAPPTGATDRGRPSRPEVTGVWFAGGAEDDLVVVVRFSEPMDTEATGRAIAILATTDSVTDPTKANPLELSEDPKWNPAGTEVLLRARAVGSTIVSLWVRSSARNTAGRELDGVVPARADQDPLGYHRVDDDGFSSAADYLSLPYYPAGTIDLASHPTPVASGMRPRIACAADGATPVEWGDLGTARGGRVQCELVDGSYMPSRSGQAERKDQRAWDPAHLPTAVYERGDRSVTAVVTMGRGVAVPGRAGAWTVFSSPTLQSLQVLEVSFATAATDVRLYVAPATAAAPLWAVRGVSPPDVLLFDPILYHADLGIGSDVVEDANAAWIADELAGQIFHTAGGDQRITGNSGARLAMASPVSCAPCAFDIILDVGARYGQGSQLRIASPSLSFEPSVPLESGEWRFRVSGGRDLLGFAHTDGIRDGDELVGAPDDTNEFTLSIP